ncbi:A-kinase anchor protein 14 [Sciurus carolinensis]|uniref:A-kinase anchor protein 14 n=1 Tax=Sciurus carolinensis TaxID=30640 RepID=A0AA41STC3_SCICA|nr:A-kinase anchor protein 14 [Sciurus carolinensis]
MDYVVMRDPNTKYSRGTWEYQSRWVHYTEFIKKEELNHSIRYIYCVRWSIPTAQVPIPRVSAAAYFTIKITKTKPPVSSFVLCSLQ